MQLLQRWVQPLLLTARFCCVPSASLSLPSRLPSPSPPQSLAGLRGLRRLVVSGSMLTPTSLLALAQLTGLSALQLLRCAPLGCGPGPAEMDEMLGGAAGLDALMDGEGEREREQQRKVHAHLSASVDSM